MDVQAWSGLTRVREIFDRVRPALRVNRAQDDESPFLNSDELVRLLIVV